MSESTLQAAVLRNEHRRLLFWSQVVAGIAGVLAYFYCMLTLVLPPGARLPRAVCIVGVVTFLSFTAAAFCLRQLGTLRRLGDGRMRVTKAHLQKAVRE